MVSIKSRIKHVEKSMIQQMIFEVYSHGLENVDPLILDSLIGVCASGDFAACINVCKMMTEEAAEDYFKYRDMFIKIVTERDGKEPANMNMKSNRSAHENVKAVYRYLEAIKMDPEAQPPVLNIHTEGTAL